MVEFHEVEKQLEDFRLRDISFRLPAGYIMGLIGENGAGKTSLLNMILGLYRPDAGTIKIFGMEYESREKEIKNKIGYVLVDEDLFPAHTKLIDNAEMFGKYYEDYRQDVLLHYCREFCLDMQKKWKQLSKGEKLKFQLAFALAHHPKLLVLDEPTANFDPEFREQFLQIVTGFVGDGEHSAILATHQTQDLDQIADYVTFLHRGKIVLSMEKEELTDRFRMVKGEDYKVNLLKPERVIYKEKGPYVTSALVRHRKIDTYDSALTVSIPVLEEIMYYYIKSGDPEVEYVKNDRR